MSTFVRSDPDPDPIREARIRELQGQHDRLGTWGKRGNSGRVKAIIVNGKRYSSVRAASDATGRVTSVLRNWAKEKRNGCKWA